MTDVGRLRVLAERIFRYAELNHEDVMFLNRTADLLDALSPETLTWCRDNREVIEALRAGTWIAVPKEMTSKMADALNKNAQCEGWVDQGYDAMLLEK